MTVSATDPVSGPYIGNGVTTAFPFSFDAGSGDEVVVVADGEELSTGFSVVINADNNGGTVTFAEAPSYDEIYIVSMPSFAQLTSFVNAGKFLPETHDAALDQAARRDLYLRSMIDRALLAPLGDVVGQLPAAADRAGQFLAFDADGNPIQSTGTGTDAGLRTDLAATGGAALVNTDQGLTVEEVAQRPFQLSFGIRKYPTSYMDAIEYSQEISDSVVGWAGHMGITGGGATTNVFVASSDGPEEEAGSFLYAFKAALASGAPAIVMVEPNGSYDATLDKVMLANVNNISVIAPGNNMRLWIDPFIAGLDVRADNLIFAGLSFCTLAKSWTELLEKKMISVAPNLAGRVAFVGCDLTRASDGALDASSSALEPTNPTHCYLTVQQCRLANTDQVIMLGSGKAKTDPAPAWATSLMTAARRLSVTIYDNIFDHTGQRQPKVLGLTEVDVANNLFFMSPWERQYPFWVQGDMTSAESPQTATQNDRGSVAGIYVEQGGWVRARGNLFVMATDDSTYATQAETAALSPAGGGAGATGGPGALVSEDNAVEGSLTLMSANEASVPAVPYVLPHSAVPAAGPLREEWIADKWRRVGGSRNAGTEGLWIAIEDDPDLAPNGQTLRRSRHNNNLLARVDRPFNPRPSNRRTSTTPLGFGPIGAGAGGSVTQITSKATGVTLNKLVGRITMEASALAGGASVSFSMTNDKIASTDVVVASIQGGATANTYQLTVDNVGTGSCRFHLRNESGTSRSEAVIITFAVIKGVVT